MFIRAGSYAISFMALFVLAGCSLFGNKENKPTIIRETTTITVRPDTGERIETIERIIASGPALPDSMTGKTSTVTLSNGNIRVGEASFEIARQLASMGWLYILGGILVAAGIAGGYFIGWNLGLIGIGAGAGVIAFTRFMDVYPWVGFIPVGLLIIAGGVIVYKLYRGERARVVNKVIVDAIEVMRPTEELDVKPIIEKLTEQIEKKAGPNLDIVKDEITKVKRELRG